MGAGVSSATLVPTVANWPRFGCYSHTCAFVQLQKESGWRG